MEIGLADTYGNLTYLVNGPNPATQYFTLGNGASVQVRAVQILHLRLENKFVDQSISRLAHAMKLCNLSSFENH